MHNKKTTFKLSTFKVINVHKRSVVQAAPDTSYVALSYVW
jgi:hypothetical protein